MPEEHEKYVEIIDRMSYKSLLKRQRFAAPGDKMFEGVTGDYFDEALDGKRAELTDEEAEKISNEVGF